jgi:hypothetical protein
LNKCYDSLGAAFACQYEKIICLTAAKGYSLYKERRFGVKTCKPAYDMDMLSDLLSLMEYSELLDLSLFSSNTYRNIKDQSCIENEGCGFELETLKVCNISTLIEKINSL